MRPRLSNIEQHRATKFTDKSGGVLSDSEFLSIAKLTGGSGIRISESFGYRRIPHLKATCLIVGYSLI